MKFFVEEFCICCKLKTGAFIIGFISVVISTVGLTFVAASTKCEGRVPFFTALYSIGIYVTIASLIAMVTSISLIAGVVKEEKWLLLPWIMFTALAILCYFLSLIMIRLSERYDLYLSSLVIITTVFIFGMYAYFLQVVASYFKELDKRGSEETAHTGQIYLAEGQGFPSNHRLLPTSPSGETA